MSWLLRRALLFPCLSRNPFSSPTEIPPHPSILMPATDRPTASHILPGEELSPCFISAPLWLAGEGGGGGGGKVNLIVVLYGHLNLQGLPPRAKNNPETQQLCPAHREDPAICFGSEPCVCHLDSFSRLALHPPHRLQHDPLLLCRVLCSVSLWLCTLQVLLSSREPTGPSTPGPVPRGHAEV